MTTKTSATEWAKRVRQWKRSGMTAAEYGEQAGFEGKRLAWWKWHLERRGGPSEERARPARATTVTFVPARIVDRAPHNGTQDGHVDIVLTNGRVVRVTGSVDAAVLAQALRVAESGGAG